MKARPLWPPWTTSSGEETPGTALITLTETGKQQTAEHCFGKLLESDQVLV